jgi:hypothetical protein
MTEADDAVQEAWGARRRVRAEAPQPDTDLVVQRRVVDAFLAAARMGDFEGLIRVLDPDVVMRRDFGGLDRPSQQPVIGAEAVAQGAVEFSRVAPRPEPAIVNGAVVRSRVGHPLSRGSPWWGRPRRRHWVSCLSRRRRVRTRSIVRDYCAGDPTRATSRISRATCDG